METIATILGVIGVALILFAYAGQQLGRMQSDDLPYLWLNLIGAVLILYSLHYHFNLPAVIIEFSWIAITLYGFWQRANKPKKTRKTKKKS